MNSDAIHVPAQEAVVILAGCCCRVEQRRKGLIPPPRNFAFLHASKSTPVGFEPTRGDPIGLAGRRLSRSAKVSSARSAALEHAALPRNNHASEHK